MDSDRIKGKAKDIAGRVERQVGEWTNDEEAQAEGAGKQIEGKVQNAFGKVKDAARDVIDKARDKAREADNRAENEGDEPIRRKRDVA